MPSLTFHLDSRTDRPDLPADVSFTLEATRLIGADQAELAALLVDLRARVNSRRNEMMTSVMLAYAHRLAARITEAINHRDLSLSFELVSLCRRECKELEWVDQDFRHGT